MKCFCLVLGLSVSFIILIDIAHYKVQTTIFSNSGTSPSVSINLDEYCKTTINLKYLANRFNYYRINYQTNGIEIIISQNRVQKIVSSSLLNLETTPSGNVNPNSLSKTLNIKYYKNKSYGNNKSQSLDRTYSIEAYMYPNNG